MRRLIVCVAVLCLGCGVVVRAEASPLFLGQFTFTLSSGFGGLPPTTVTAAYLFEDAPPIFVDSAQTEARYEVISWTVTVSGLSFPALPLQILVWNDLPTLSPPILVDGYHPGATLSGTYLDNFRLLGVGLDFEKFGTPPLAFTDLTLPTSVADLSGFTEVDPFDHRSAVLVFENLATGGFFAPHAPTSSFTITPVPEPATWLLFSTGLLGLLGYSWQWKKRTA
jgi:hypothetical protein